MAVFISLSKYQKKELARFERVCRNQREHEERNQPKGQGHAENKDESPDAFAASRPVES